MKSIRVELVEAFAETARVAVLILPAGSTVAGALAAAGLPADGKVGIFGEVVDASVRLADGDRVEIYRPLRQDPKEARRRRAKARR